MKCVYGPVQALPLEWQPCQINFRLSVSAHSLISQQKSNTSWSYFMLLARASLESSSYMFKWILMAAREAYFLVEKADESPCFNEAVYNLNAWENSSSAIKQREREKLRCTLHFPRYAFIAIIHLWVMCCLRFIMQTRRTFFSPSHNIYCPFALFIAVVSWWNK